MPQKGTCLNLDTDIHVVLFATHRALSLSEFSAPRWQVPGPGGAGETLGQAILRANDLDNPHWWIGAAVGILIGYAVLGNIVLNIALRMLNGAAP